MAQLLYGSINQWFVLLDSYRDNSINPINQQTAFTFYLLHFALTLAPL